MYQVNFKSPLGNLVLTASDSGVTNISPGRCNDEKNNSVLIQLSTELKEYFQAERTEFTVPLDLQGTPFQNQCWQALQKIPYGETISYKEQACRVATAKHTRAVAGANNKNQIPIVIPCHRVIGIDGSLVGFAWGLDKKQFLLELESGASLD